MIKKRIPNKFNHTLAIIFFSENKFWHPLKIAIVLNLYSTFFSSIQKFIVFIFQAAAATMMQLIASTSLLNKNQLEIRSRNRKIPDPYYPSYRPYNTLGFPHRPLLPHPDFRPISNNSWKLKTYASIIIILFVDCNNKKINNKTFLCLWICRRVVYQSWIITAMFHQIKNSDRLGTKNRNSGNRNMTRKTHGLSSSSEWN